MAPDIIERWKAST